jgi:hypothetical protein
VAHLDRAITDGVCSLKTGNNLTGRKSRNLEFVVSRFRDCLCENFTCAKDRIERLREARREAPFDLRAGLRDRRCCDCARCEPCARDAKKLPAFHNEFVS